MKFKTVVLCLKLLACLNGRRSFGIIANIKEKRPSILAGKLF